MANDEQKKIDANVQEGELAQSVKDKNQFMPVWIALSIVLVISLASSVWLYMQQQSRVEQQSQQSEQLSKLADSTESLQNALQARSQKLKKLEATQLKLTTQLADLETRQQFSSAELLAEWSKQEVEFLLNVANQRALLAKDVNGAKTALQMADAKLQKMGDYRLHPLRALIAEEVLALDALADLDIAGMGIQLQAMINHVDSLRVVKGPQVNVQAAVDDAGTTAQAAWQKAVSDIWQQIRSLVVIRHDDTGDAAVLLPEQRYFLYQNVKLQLETARLSLLKADETGFKQSLTTASEWLQQYFIGDERDAMLANLQSLQAKPVTISIPDLSASLKWIQEYQQ